MSEYCPTCFRKLPIPGGVGTFLTDPILTPKGLSGDQYKGLSFIRSLYRETSTYYTISTKIINSSYYNRRSISPRHMMSITHQQIEQIRINIENIMFYLNFPLAFYFQKDYKGDSIGLTKTEWVDVNRITVSDYEKITGKNPYTIYQNILNGTIPLLPPKQKIRAIHIEELRISIYFQRILENFEIGNFYQCPEDDQIYHKDYVLIKENDENYYCPDHTDEILIPKEEANTDYHKETFPGYEPSIITGDYTARVCGQQSNFYVTASGGAGNFFAGGNIISSIKQQEGLVKIAVDVDTTINNIDRNFYSTSSGRINMKGYGQQSRAKTTPTATDTTMSLNGLTISGTNYQCAISLDIKLIIYKKIGEYTSRKEDDKTFTLIFFTDGGYKDSLKDPDTYENKSGYFIDNDGYLNFRFGTWVTKLSKIWYPVEDIENLNLINALKYEYPDEEEPKYALNMEQAVIGDYFIQEISINTLEITMETQNYTSDAEGVNSSSSNIEFQIEYYDFKSKEYNVFFSEDISSQVNGVNKFVGLGGDVIIPSVVIKLNETILTNDVDYEIIPYNPLELPEGYEIVSPSPDHIITIFEPPLEGSSLWIEYLAPSNIEYDSMEIPEGYEIVNPPPGHVINVI